jgi:hypothetical protein
MFHKLLDLTGSFGPLFVTFNTAPREKLRGNPATFLVFGPFLLDDLALNYPDSLK